MKVLVIVSRIVDEGVFVREVICNAPAVLDLRYRFEDCENHVYCAPGREDEAKEYLKRNRVRCLVEDIDNE